MNDLLSIKLPFASEKNPSKLGPRNLNKSRKISSQKIRALIHDLERIQSFYSQNPQPIQDCLIDVHYIDIIAKSGRIQELFRMGKEDCNDFIVGARFSNPSKTIQNHIITYYIDKKHLQIAINELREAAFFIDNVLNGEATKENFDSSLILDYSSSTLKKDKLRGIIIDSSAIDSFQIPNILEQEYSQNDAQIVTFYATEVSVSDLLSKLEITNYYSVSKNTISVDRDTLDILIKKIPHLICMVASDISKISISELGNNEKEEMQIPDPTNEPVIGVIDTLFDTNVYFSKWVEYHEALDTVEKYTTTHSSDYIHGTSISSLIVDGPFLNPWLDDGCGRFRVRHFGVCKDRISPSRLVRKIEDIVRNNLDIHVWNLSLGTEEEVSRNFMSFDAAALDEIQSRYDVIFVISGTNDNRLEKDNLLRIGSPADSLNSLVVNSVRKEKTSTSYTRKGPVLSFFNKPDASYYGGDFDERIKVCSNMGIDEMYGTSFAAPWISRKLSYLIDVLGFSREIAKALIIDSAANWSYKQITYKNQNEIGFGVVPISIFDVIQCKDDEIRFVLSGTSKSYKTSNYALPIPKDDENKSSYVARATLCYFPICNRLQGVDYTQRELSIKFGIVNNIKILDVNHNIQDDEGEYSDERKARNDFRKWDNTKLISALLTNRNKPKKLYNEGFYGVSVTSKERQKVAKQSPLKFGIVVTLKNIKGQNRVEEFKRACLLRGYIVNPIQIQNKIDVYNMAQEEIKFN